MLKIMAMTTHTSVAVLWMMYSLDKFDRLWAGLVDMVCRFPLRIHAAITETTRIWMQLIPYEAFRLFYSHIHITISNQCLIVVISASQFYACRIILTGPSDLKIFVNVCRYRRSVVPWYCRNFFLIDYRGGFFCLFVCLFCFLAKAMLL